MEKEDSPPKEAARWSGGSWQRLMWAMVGIQFTMTLSFTILSPIMPLFLPDLGVKDAALIDLWAGILNGATPFVAAFASPLWGRLADQYGRKQALIRASLAIGVFTIGMGLSQNVWQFFGARLLMGAFAGFSAASIALVASQVPESRLGYALGWLSTGQLVGGLVGPVLGGGIADLTGSYRVPFFATAAFTFLALGLVALFVHEQFTRPKGAARKLGILAALRALGRSRGLLALFVVLLLAQFAVRTVQPVVTLFVQELSGDNTAAVATLAGVAFSVTGVADVLASPFLGKRSDVIGYRRVLLISLMGAALMTLPQAFAHSFWTFVAERFGVGCFIGGILPTANALVGRQVPRGQRGTVYGMTASATFLGNSLGPITGGGIAAAVSIRFVFVVTAALLAITWFWVYRRVDEYCETGKLAEAPAE
ncbi:MAG TPA: MFS transporter [Acetobacteraceae bacterium]|nr:MFS transporter [Acetobacteraceae bacterium]